MKILLAGLCFYAASLGAQGIALIEHPNATAKSSLFLPADSASTDGIESARASGPYRWNLTPVINESWDRSKKSLLLVIEVVGDAPNPSTAVFVIDGKTFTVQSADWGRDSRGNLCTILEKEGLIRNLAKAENASVTVFAPFPVSASFQSQDLGVFRSMVEAFDSNAPHPSESEIEAALAEDAAHPVKDGVKVPVTLITQESSVTSYDWQVDGRVYLTCTGESCSGHYTLPAAGTQQIQGAVLKLLRPDASVAIARCISKVNVLSSTMSALDAVSANDPNAPTVYRDCRVPSPYSTVEAEFHRKTVKLFWHYDGMRGGESETYELIGVLQPTSTP